MTPMKALLENGIFFLKYNLSLDHNENVTYLKNMVFKSLFKFEHQIITTDHYWDIFQNILSMTINNRAGDGLMLSSNRHYLI